MSAASDQKSKEQPGRAGVRAVPGTVIALGTVSLFMDVSSEMIHSLVCTENLNTSILVMQSAKYSV